MHIDQLRSSLANVYGVVWDICGCTETNRLDLFRRVPSDLRRYMDFTWRLKRDYGSVMQFVLGERLRWTDLGPSGDAPPFTNPGAWDPQTHFTPTPWVLILVLLQAWEGRGGR